jgi:hypothetical protein
MLHGAAVNSVKLLDDRKSQFCFVGIEVSGGVILIVKLSNT